MRRLRVDLGGFSARVVMAVGTTWLALGALPRPALAIDWSGVPSKEVLLFQTGHSSWEWLLTEKDHSGGPKIREGKTCQDCHAGEERKIGELIASGKKIEPHPVAQRRATIPVQVQTAHDGERLHMRFEWPDSTASSGEKMEPDFKNQLSVLIARTDFKDMRVGGCWATCHDDLPKLPSAEDGTKLTKYLAGSRTRIRRSGGGENYKDAAAFDKLLQQGKFYEFWQAQLNPGQPAVAAEGYVLDKRHEGAAKALAATGTLEDGRWVVELSRKLDAGGKSHHKIEKGKSYTFGIAIHEDWANGRFHQVSLEQSLRLDSGDANFVAVKK